MAEPPRNGETELPRRGVSADVIAVAFWLYMCASLVISDLLHVHYGGLPTPDFALGIGTGVLAAWWYKRDSWECGGYRPGYEGLVFLLPFVFVPIHLVRTMGWKAGGRVIVQIAGWAVLSVFAAGIAGFVLAQVGL